MGVFFFWTFSISIMQMNSQLISHWCGRGVRVFIFLIQAANNRPYEVLINRKISNNYHGCDPYAEFQPACQKYEHLAPNRGKNGKVKTQVRETRSCSALSKAVQEVTFARQTTSLQSCACRVQRHLHVQISKQQATTVPCMSCKMTSGN